MNQAPVFLTLADRTLAYQHFRAKEGAQGVKSVFFLSGFSSDMAGTKATFLAEQCAREGYGYTRFDYRGHGQSSGSFEDGSIGDWLDDALKIFDQVTEGPQILVGSSMGGWIGLLLARERPERVAGFLGIAAAPDFTEDLIRPTMTPEQTEQMERNGFFYEHPEPAAGEPDDRTPITRKLMKEARDRLVLRAPLSIAGPVRFIQGQKDTEVPWQTALRLASHIEQDDIRTILVKDGDHHLSRPQDLDLVWQTLRTGF